MSGMVPIKKLILKGNEKNLGKCIEISILHSCSEPYTLKFTNGSPLFNQIKIQACS